MLTASAILGGYILDLFLGDPHWLPHPIVLIGNLIGFLDKRLRRLAGTDVPLQALLGLLMVIIVCFLSFAVPFLILYYVGQYSRWLSFALEVVMFYQIFAVRSLKDESMKVYYALVAADLPKARQYLSWIVGRDTKELSAEEVTKAAVETIAENTSDGIIAPMFYMFIGGAPLAFLYKGINTMDSMVGYKNDKYLHFGRYAAKLDDIVNLIPARLSAFFMLLAAVALNLDYKNGWRIFCRDRLNHLSPNSAQTESVIAGALRVQLGGGHNYFGQYVYKQTIGDDDRAITAEDIPKTNSVLYIASSVGLVFFFVLKLLHCLL